MILLNSDYSNQVMLTIVSFIEAFPDDCHYYRGPHSSECLLALWRMTDCLEEGSNVPSNMSDGEKSALDRMNIRLVLGV